VRELIVTENITVDGVIDMAKGWFDPAGPPGVDTSDLQQVMREQGAGSDALLLGRQTFEDFRGYWPLQRDDTTGTTAYLNQVARYVVSSTLQDPEWENTTVLRGDPIKGVRALKTMPASSTSPPPAACSSSPRWSPAAWSTSTGCSCTPLWPARGSGCSPMPPTLARSAWSRPSPTAQG
jgi:hypothetical protein